MSTIKDIEAQIINDSRGMPTIEVKIRTQSGASGIASVPSGTSTGKKEATLVDPKVGCENINKIIAPKLIGMDIQKQAEIDQTMVELDGTEEKSQLGANAILGVSLATARTAANFLKIPLYQYLNQYFCQISGVELKPAVPTPMMVMICGGKHGGNKLCIQEFLIISQVKNGIKIWHQIEKILHNRKIQFKIGLEGAFSPDIVYDEEALEIIVQGLSEAGFQNGHEVFLGLDIAGNHCHISNEEILKLHNKYNIFSIEDPFGEYDWEKFGQLKLELEEGSKDFLLLGDDLFATHKKLLQKGINNLVANGIIIKVNQVGTLTETMEVIALAKKADYTHVVSHRSGETNDTFIADLAVATAAKFIKSGAPIPKERLLKYQRLEEIQREFK